MSVNFLEYIPHEIFKEEVSSFLNIDTLKKFVSTSKSGRKLMISRLNNLILRYRRDDMNYMYPYIPNLSLSYFPVPKLRFGMSDFDTHGNPIPENMRSNDEWHLTLMRYNPQDFKELSNLDSVFEYPGISGSWCHLAKFLKSPIELMRRVTKGNANIIYNYNNELVDKHFVETGEFNDIVHLNDITRQRFITMSEYPLCFYHKYKGKYTSEKVSKINIRGTFYNDVINYLKKHDIKYIMDTIKFNYHNSYLIDLIRDKVLLDQQDEYIFKYLHLVLNCSNIYITSKILYYIRPFESHLKNVTDKILKNKCIPCIFKDKCDKDTVSILKYLSDCSASREFIEFIKDNYYKITYSEIVD